MPPPTSPVPLSAIPTLSTLYTTSRLPTSSSSPPSPYAPSAALNARISLLRTDITTLAVGAIVNAANNSLLGGGGVDGAIHARAGPELLAECRALGGCATGDAKLTGAGQLPCAAVVHAVGPVYWIEREREEGREERLLRGCYVKALELAREEEVGSVAFSCLSAGVYGYPSRKAASVACRAVREWLVERETEGWGGVERVVFCCFEPKDERAYQEILPYFFPPADDNDSAAPSTSAAASGAETTNTDDTKANPTNPSTTNPPTSPSADHETPHHPSPKKAKLGSPSAAPNDDGGWEAVDRGRASAPNGRAERTYDDGGEDYPGRATSADEDVMSQEKKEVAAAALHTAQTGGDPPRSALEKDW